MNCSLARFFLFIVVESIVIFSPCSSADVQGKMIAFNCYSCHGENLNELNLPQSFEESDLTRTLLEFKYDKTNAIIMNRISKGYTDSELKSVATFISKLN